MDAPRQMLEALALDLKAMFLAVRCPFSLVWVLRPPKLIDRILESFGGLA